MTKRVLKADCIAGSILKSSYEERKSSLLTTHTAFDIISGACDPQDHVPNEFSSSESELEETQQSPKITKFDQLVFDIGRAVDSLYRVSTELRKGIPKDRYTKSSKIDVSLYEPYDIQSVREKFPAAKDFLVNRLGKAVSKRRQYFRYRELHHTRLSRGLLFGDIDGTEATKPEDESLSEIGTQGGEATAATFIEPSNSGSGQSGLSESHITSTALRQVPSVVSFATEASYAASVGTNGKSRMPSMPLETFGAPFDCPNCYKKVSVYRSFRSEAWEIHVLKDLQAYVCTFDGCSTSGETYESRSQWYNHELQQHRQIWTCFGHCGRQFRYKEEFETHVREHRPNGLSIEQMPLYIDNSASPWDQSDVDFVRCPLCTGEVQSSLFLEKHLGRHLEEIALLSFPSSQCDSAGELDSDDDSERNEGTSSEQMEEVSQEGYDEWYTFYGLGSKNLEGIEGEEIEKQTVLHEIITTEQKHLAQLDIWHQDHHDLMIESTSFHIRRKDDPREAFRSIKNIYDVGRAELLLPFQHRQNEQGPWIIGLGDIFQKWISKAQTHFLSFAASYPAARATIRLALLERTPNADSINRIEDDKRSERLGMEHYLNSPIARLKQCERLIVTALASRGLSSDLEQSNLQDVTFYIRELLRKCNSMISKATAKVNVLGLEADLVWRPDLSPAKLPYLDLFAAGRRLLYRGDLLMTGSGDNRFRWSLVHGILLDNYLLLTKVRPHKGVYDLSGDDKVVHVIHMVTVYYPPPSLFY